MTLRLVEPVGRGASSVVWRATWGGRPVAAKVLDGRIPLDEALVELDAGALALPLAFVRTLEVTQHEGSWVVLREWVEGEPVDQLIARRGPAPAEVVRAVLAAVARPMAQAWATNGLVHGDLKPANLLVDREGVVRIADLGLAGWTGRDPSNGGTPGYAAPERFVGGHGAPAEVYALGCIAAELLTGRPFGPCGAHELAQRRRQRALDADLREVGAPRPLADTILRALGWCPSDRPTWEEWTGLQEVPELLAWWAGDGVGAEAEARCART
ncbi:MAG: serine/threonine protein kinase [Alphaproteobacteria bacterium]|nr:serine/threonine protein kinase [Alphaproteobacteria bacterium]